MNKLRSSINEVKVRSLLSKDCKVTMTTTLRVLPPRVLRLITSFITVRTVIMHIVERKSNLEMIRRIKQMGVYV